MSSTYCLAIDQLQNGGSFAKTKVRIPFSVHYKFLYICMDTGNNSQSVIDEQVFKAIHPGGDLEPSDLPLTGPSEGHILTVLGRSKDILELEFYNPENKTSLKYHVRPVVVKNLHVPFILS